MGGCESAASEEVSSPKKVQKKQRTLKVEKHKFTVPNGLKEVLEVMTDNGKITDYITKNQLKIKNNYQLIDITDKLGIDKKFEDEIFPPQNVSLGKEPFAANVSWHRPQNFMQGEYHVFEGQIQPKDIKQGRLSDCYLLSAISSISEYPFIVKRIFETTEQSTYGFYGVWLFIDGVWECVVVDDYFPVYKKKPLYTRNHENELWVMLLEKAYAKVFKSYEAIESGLTGVAMNALTGAPFEYLCKDSSNRITSEEAWKFITENLSQNYLLNGSTENNDRNGYLGLISTHTYAIMDCRQVKIRSKSGKKKERVIKLSNPWGKYEWKGRWSEGSNVWTQQLKKELHYTDENDGIFWMSVEDFIDNFGQISVCKYNKNNITTSFPISFPQTENGFKALYMGVHNQTEGYISLIQKDHRHFLNTNYEYSLVRLIILQINRNSRTLEKYIGDTFDCDRDATIQVSLNPGQYYIIVEMDWKGEFTRDAVLNFYGQHSVNFIEDKNPLEMEELFHEVVQIHQNYTEKERIFVYESQPLIRRVTGSLAGYVYYHYTNKSKKHKYLCESVVLKERAQIEVEGEERPGDFMVKVYPGQQKVVRLKAQKEGNSYYSFSTKIQFYIVDNYTLDKLRDVVDRNPTKIKKREAADKELNVRVKTLNYSGGIALLYQNKMEKHIYVEQIQITMENLEFQNGELNKWGKLQLVIPPRGEKLLSFVVMRPDKEVVFKSQVSFHLKPAEGQN